MRKIRFPRPFTAAHVLSYGDRLVPELKPGQAPEQLTASAALKARDFAVGDGVEMIAIPIEAKSRQVVTGNDRRPGAILDDAVRGADFKIAGQSKVPKSANGTRIDPIISRNQAEE